MMKLQWFFDYVSPYSYLQWAHQLPRIKDAEVELKPVLFAGLLKHWGHKGPVEIPGKRRFTYRYTIWLAERLGVPFRLPSGHPFNPLPLLRLSLARNNRPDVVERLFTYVWRDGHVPSDDSSWRQLVKDLAVSESELKDPGVKQRLLDNGEEAIAKGVFGVPTVMAGDELFWGVDGFEFLMEYLGNPAVIRTPEMQAADTLPSGV